MSFDTVNFEWEATRIAEAFGVRTPLRFDWDYPRGSQNPSEDGYQKLMVDPLMSPVEDWLLRPRLENDVELVVTYYKDRMVFMLDRSGFEEPSTRERDWDTIAEVELGYDGSLNHGLAHDDLSLILAKGLFFLDLLNPEVENELWVTISNEQLAQWQLEYSPRMRTANSRITVTGGFNYVLRKT